MTRLIIICEGPTEQEFCKDVLSPFFLSIGIQIQFPLIKKSGGGIVPWNILFQQIITHLRERDVFVTILIDYYGIQDRFAFPGWEDSKMISDKNKRMDFIEMAMRNVIPDTFNHRFIPYVQLHEFEGLLFNNIQTFEETFEKGEFKDKNELEKVLFDHPNPEMINDDPKTAPSKRLINLIEGYNKIVYGSILAQNIGLERLRMKSPRFNGWIVKLEEII
jgi:hypothetical protein